MYPESVDLVTTVPLQHLYLYESGPRAKGYREHRYSIIEIVREIPDCDLLAIRYVLLSVIANHEIKYRYLIYPLQ